MIKKVEKALIQKEKQYTFILALKKEIEEFPEEAQNGVMLKRLDKNEMKVKAQVQVLRELFS